MSRVRLWPFAMKCCGDTVKSNNPNEKLRFALLSAISRVVLVIIIVTPISTITGYDYSP